MVNGISSSASNAAYDLGTPSDESTVGEALDKKQRSDIGTDLASVRVDGDVSLGIGNRNPQAGLNWLYGAMNVTEMGVAAAKLFQNKPLTTNDKVTLKFQVEFGDLDKIPGLGPMLKALVPKSEHANAGTQFKVQVSGDGQGGLRIASAEGIVYFDVPHPGGVLNINSAGKATHGLKGNQGGTTVQTGFKWTPESGMVGNNDIYSWQIAGFKKPEEGARFWNFAGFSGWTLIAKTSNQKELEGMQRVGQHLVNQAVGGGTGVASQVGGAILGAGQIKNVFNDVNRALTDAPPQLVGADKVPRETTVLGIVKGVVKDPLDPVGLFVNGTVAMTATQDGKPNLDVYTGGHKVFSTTTAQIAAAGEKLMDSLRAIPIVQNFVPAASENDRKNFNQHNFPTSPAGGQSPSTLSPEQKRVIAAQEQRGLEALRTQVAKTLGNTPGAAVGSSTVTIGGRTFNNVPTLPATTATPATAPTQAKLQAPAVTPLNHFWDALGKSEYSGSERNTRHAQTLLEKFAAEQPGVLDRPAYNQAFNKLWSDYLTGATRATVEKAASEAKGGGHRPPLAKSEFVELLRLQEGVRRHILWEQQNGFPPMLPAQTLRQLDQWVNYAIKHHRS